MGKLNIQDIAGVLVARNALDKNEATRFVAAMFSLIQERLETDRVVKVKGLGTFKIIDVEARESVSVRTGKRVVIVSHPKVTFTPDALMKDLVNKPFSQFETVVLNDGVEFKDMPESEPEQELESEQEPEQEIEIEVGPEFDTIVVEEDESVENATEKPSLIPVYEPVIEDTIQDEDPEDESKEGEVLEDEEEVIEDEESKDESIAGEAFEAEESENDPIEEVAEDEDDDSGKHRILYWVLGVLGVLLLMAASAAAGFYFGQQYASRQVQSAMPAEVPVMMDEPDSVVVDSSTVVSVDTVAAKPAPVEAEPAPIETEPAPVITEQSSDKYAEMDARVKYGAYRIIGDDYAVKVRPGDTTARIAKRTLGEGMECYIEVYNGIKSNADLKEGQTVMIPKLKWKKKRK